MKRLRPGFIALTVMTTTVGCGTLEKSLLFQPAKVLDAQPVPADVRAEDVALRLPNGTPIHARWFPANLSPDVILFCHGNAGNLFDRTRAILQLREALGESVLIFDYPGYGRSGGEPSEASLNAAADVAYDWLTQKQGVSPQRIVIFGESLGGGVAVDLASRRPHRALVLVKSFTSIPDLAHEKIPWLPRRGMISSRFDNLGKIPLCQGPIFIAHGTADQLVPYAHGDHLYMAAREPKQFLPLANQGHNDPLPPEFYGALRDFLTRMDARPDVAAPRAARLGAPTAN